MWSLKVRFPDELTPRIREAQSRSGLSLNKWMVKVVRESLGAASEPGRVRPSRVASARIQDSGPEGAAPDVSELRVDDSVTTIAAPLLTSVPEPEGSPVGAKWVRSCGHSEASPTKLLPSGRRVCWCGVQVKG